MSLPARLAGIGLAILSACAVAPRPSQMGPVPPREQTPEEALIQIREAIAREPDNGELYLGLGNVFVGLGEPAEAEAAFARAADLGQRPRANMRIARLRRLEGRYQEAARLLHEALSLTADDGALHYELGRVQLAAGDNTSAVASFETATGLAPGFGPAFVDLASALGTLGRYDDAAEVLEDALGREPKLPPAPLAAKLGEMYEALGRGDDAGRAFRQALRDDPDNVEATAGHARALWATRDEVHAIELLRKAIEKHPDAALLHLEIGLAYEEFRVPNQAVESLFEATNLDPGLKRAYAPLLRLIEADPLHRDLLFTVLARAVKVFPDDFEIQLRFAREASRLGKYEAIIPAATRVIAIKPSHVEGNFLLGLAQARSGDRTAAMETHDALLILDPPTAAKLKQEITGPEVQSATTGAGAAAPAKTEEAEVKAMEKKKKKDKKRAKKKRRRRR